MDCKDKLVSLFVLFGWLVWLVCWLVGWLFGWLVGWFKEKGGEKKRRRRRREQETIVHQYLLLVGSGFGCSVSHIWLQL